jgi:uncharacterized protein (DUF885 family)
LLCLTLPSRAQSTDADVDRFFQSFVETWVRNDPETASVLRIFPPEEQARLDGLLSDASPEQTQERLRRIRTSLAGLKRFDRGRMSASRRVAADVLQWTFEEMLRAEPFLGHDYLFNQMRGAPTAYVDFLVQRHPIRSATDGRNYIARLRASGRKAGQWIELARAAEAKGVLPPRHILQLTTRQLQGFVDPRPEANLLVTGFRERLDRVTAIPAMERAQLVRDAEAAVAETLYPAWRRVIAFLEAQTERASPKIGFAGLPRGEAAYASMLRWNTTTDLTASRIHEIGLKEVSRIEAVLDRTLRGIGLHDGTVGERYRQLGRRQDVAYADAPDVRDRILADYSDHVRVAESKVQSIFRLPASRPVIVRRTPAFREATAAAEYAAPPLNGNEPGIFFVPLRGPQFNRLGMRTLAHHEAVPGHHFQHLFRIQQQDAPLFRRGSMGTIGGRALGSFPAYGEGWALYAEQLADEIGLYASDPIGRLGYLQSELFRAARLVVDTGIHAKGWTRQQAIHYMAEREPRSGMAEPEVDRYIAMPGQACAYKIGQMRILELREKARRALGARFDLRDFHTVILANGAVPLQVLSRLVDDYIRQSGRVAAR